MSLWNAVKKFNCFCSAETVNVDNRKFVVRGRIGDGGFAVIDLVEDKYTKKYFALKIITCHSTEDEREALKEVSYMTKLKHPNLVPCEVHSIKPSQHGNMLTNDVLIVMPFYKRGTLWDEIVRCKLKSQFLQEERICSLLHGICNALHYLHSYKEGPIAHRDIKPLNVMLKYDNNNNNNNATIDHNNKNISNNHHYHSNSNNNNNNNNDSSLPAEIPVLIDFGSMGAARCVINTSSEARRLQDFASEKCSMPYRAPELFQVEPSSNIDEKVDIWSLGCTLYAMCFHESPFDKVQQRGDSIALAAMAGNIKIPTNHNYSATLMNVMMMMMKVDPKERPSAMEIINLLPFSPNKNQNFVHNGRRDDDDDDDIGDDDNDSDVI